MTNPERILVTGASGMVGSRFVQTHHEQGDLLTPTREEFDLIKPESVSAYFSSHPEITGVVHFAAYTDVGGAQKQKGQTDEACYQLNVVGTRNLIDQIKDRDIYFVHASTDMVHSGNKADPGPYDEDHPIKPNADDQSWYGYTKALAELLVRENIPDAAIFRLIYPVDFPLPSDRKLNYLAAPLAFFEQREVLYPIFPDQSMNITDTKEACLGIDRLLEKKLAGVFHAGSTDITTPYVIMTHLFDLVHGHHNMVESKSITEFLKTQNDPTRYPEFGGLLNKKTGKQLEVYFSSSTEIIDRLYRK